MSLCSYDSFPTSNMKLEAIMATPECLPGKFSVFQVMPVRVSKMQTLPSSKFIAKNFPIDVNDSFTTNEVVLISLKQSPLIKSQIKTSRSYPPDTPIIPSNDISKAVI